MPSETIVQSVVDFLKQYPPFDQLKEQELHELASHVNLNYFEVGDILFSEGGAPLPTVFVVKKGNIKLKRKHNDTEVLLDAGAVGGFFTVSATLSEEDYDIFKESDDKLGTKTKDVYIQEIGNEPKEYSLTGFYGGGTSAEVVFTVRKEPVFN